MARPTKYRPEFAEQAVKLCRLGATDDELADFFGVTTRSINNWKRDHPGFFQSLKAGKILADAEVADKLFKRATGYEHADVHVSNYQGVITLTPVTKVYPADTTAAIFWLKNRQPKMWKAQPDETQTPEAPAPVKVVVGVQDASIPEPP